MIRVAALADIPADRGVQVEHNGEKILLVRDGGAVRAYQGECPHAGAPLAEGAVCGGRIICPWHKAEFALDSGALLEPPALLALARYAVRIENDAVLIGEKQDAAAAPAAGSGVALIVGAGAAAAACAASLREFGYGGRIVMAAPEGVAPYDRTALSKFVLAGEMPPDDVPPLLPEDFEAAQRIERVRQAVTALDVARRRAVFAQGDTLDFDTALIATGAVPRRLDVPGADLEGVHVLRSRADAASIVAALQPGQNAVVIGTSFIGLEAACGLRARRIEVAVVGPDEFPFVRRFGEQVGRAMRALHEANGVVFHTGTKPARLEGDGRVAAVVLDNGQTLPADIVLVAVGVRPAVDFVQGVARNDDGSLSVDAHMRVSDGVYAAGDVARFALPEGGAARIEHWRVAQQHGRIAAANMAGGSASYDGVPFFWTYHYGKNIEYLGHAEDWQETVVIGDVGGMDFVVLLVQGGAVAAVVACQRESVTARLIYAMRERLSVARAREIIGDR